MATCDRAGRDLVGANIVHPATGQVRVLRVLMIEALHLWKWKVEVKGLRPVSAGAPGTNDPPPRNGSDNARQPAVVRRVRRAPAACGPMIGQWQWQW